MGIFSRIFGVDKTANASELLGKSMFNVSGGISKFHTRVCERVVIHGYKGDVDLMDNAIMPHYKYNRSDYLKKINTTDSAVIEAAQRFLEHENIRQLIESSQLVHVVESALRDAIKKYIVEGWGNNQPTQKDMESLFKKECSEYNALKQLYDKSFLKLNGHSVRSLHTFIDEYGYEVFTKHENAGLEKKKREMMKEKGIKV